MRVIEKNSIGIAEGWSPQPTNNPTVEICTTFEIDEKEAAETSVNWCIASQGDVVRYELVSNGELVEVDLPINAPKDGEWTEPGHALYIIFWRIANGEASDADIEIADMIAQEWWGVNADELEDDVIDGLARFDEHVPYRLWEFSITDEDGNVLVGDGAGHE